MWHLYLLQRLQHEFMHISLQKHQRITFLLSFVKTFVLWEFLFQWDVQWILY